MANSILDNNVTYSLLIDTAAGLLYNQLKSYSVNAGTYRQNAVSMKIGGGTFKNGEAVPTYTVKIKAPEEISESYTSPTKGTIKNDIVKFLDSLGIPCGDDVPTPDGIISFFFALNFFVEKAVIKRVTNADSTPTLHLHYKAPSSSSYSMLPFELYDANKVQKDLNSVTVDKIGNIYNQLKTTSLLSDDARKTNIASGTYSSSSSSSSCSSSSSSSSSSCSCSSSSSLFVAYFNIG